MQHEIVCTCGLRPSARSPSAARIRARTSHEMRGELAALIDQGKTHDEIIQAFIAKYGSQEMLGAPIDKGFNRLAWLFPYLVGATGVVAVGFAAVQWSRHARRPGRRTPRRSTPRSTSASTMSSETSTEQGPAEADPPTRRSPDADGLQPWQFFVLAALGCATAVTFMARGQGVDRRHPAQRADGRGGARRLSRRCARCGRWCSPEDDRTVMVGQRTRVALEREKLLTLRSIKELEFDRAMGKLSDEDWQEMSGRLRARAARLMRQLDAGAGYREQIEQDSRKRLGRRRRGPRAATPARSRDRRQRATPQRDADLRSPARPSNDADAKFCKQCGAQAVTAQDDDADGVHRRSCCRSVSLVSFVSIRRSR